MKLGPLHKKLASKRRRTHLPEPSASNGPPLLPMIPSHDIHGYSEQPDEEFRDLYLLADMVQADIQQEPFNELAGGSAINKENRKKKKKDEESENLTTDQ